jgi:hypothetical protein
MTRRSHFLPSFALLLGVVSSAGCSPAGASAGPAPAFAPDTSAPQSQYGSHATVGLRVLTDPAPDESRYHLAAVVRDQDGVEEVHDLGEYEGPVTEETPVDNELLRIHVSHPSGPAMVTVRNAGNGVLEVHHVPDSGEQPTVRRIPVRTDTPVRASDVRVHRVD